MWNRYREKEPTYTVDKCLTNAAPVEMGLEISEKIKNNTSK